MATNGFEHRVRKEEHQVVVAPSWANRPWLFEAFPGLRHRVPWTALVSAPTPVHRLTGFGRNANYWTESLDDKIP